MRTIKQHEPLRVPERWGTQERQFIVQLEGILDDLYGKFNRIKMSDLGSALSEKISNTSDLSKQNSKEIATARHDIEGQGKSLTDISKDVAKNTTAIESTGEEVMNLGVNLGQLQADEIQTHSLAQKALDTVEKQKMNFIMVSGSTPVINASDGCYYICGEVETISFIPPASGVCSVTFTSGATAAVVTIPETVVMPDWWEGAEADTQYKITITNGTEAEVRYWPI